MLFTYYKMHCLKYSLSVLHLFLMELPHPMSINLINSSPTTYNAQAYKYTYSLSKDERSNTVVKTLLTIR